MKKIIATGLILATMAVSTASVAQDNKTVKVTVADLLAIGKTGGICAVMVSMTNFQKEKQLEKGNEFLQSFWSSQLQQMGVTPEQFVQSCASIEKSSAKLLEDSQKQ